MRAAVIEKPGIVTVENVPMPEVGEYDVLIRVASSGVCGTDLHIFQGEYVGSYPIIPGHEFAGVVESVGSKVTRFTPGDRAAVEPNISCGNCHACLNNRQNFCRNRKAIGVDMPGGMAEFAAVPESAAFHLDNLSYTSGAFVEPLSCVIHGVQQSGVRLGDHVLILGAGPIGILLARVMQLHGAAEISQTDRSTFRLARAAELNGVIPLPADTEFQENAYDLVVDATGSPTVMEETVRLVREGGNILFFGVPPKESTISLPAFSLFSKGITLSAVYTSVRNSIQAVRLLSSGAVQAEPLVTHELPLEKLAYAFELMTSSLDEVMKIHMLPESSQLHHG